MGWNYFKQGHCPVCDGVKKDCRQNSDNGLVHCRDFEANPLDWVFIGTDSLGFGMWAKASKVEAWKQKKREEWIAEKKTAKRGKKKEKAKRRKRENRFAMPG